MSLHFMARYIFDSMCVHLLVKLVQKRIYGAPFLLRLALQKFRLNLVEDLARYFELQVLDVIIVELSVIGSYFLI